MASLSVVIPVRDEEETIGPVLESIARALSTLDAPAEIIVVDDGSSDRSAKIASDKGARVVSHRYGRGYGAALKTGIKQATGETILIIDGDGTYPAESIPELLTALQESDMAVGARTLRGAKIPALRRPAKWFLTRLASFLSGQNIPDLNSGLRAFRKRDVAKYLRLLPDKFSFTSTLTLLMMGDGKSIQYVPIEYHKRGGKSKIVPGDAFSFLLLIIRTIMFFNPLKFFFPIGLVIFIVGAAKLFSDIFVYDRLSATPVLLILSALQLWGLGFLAELMLFLQRRRE